MKDKIIVLTMYGKDEHAESVSITSFDREREYYAGGGFTEYPDPRNSAFNYCSNINDLELKDNHWISAQIIHENQKISIVYNLPEEVSSLFSKTYVSETN